FSFGYCCSSCLPTTSISACAAFIVTPGLRRATICSQYPTRRFAPSLTTSGDQNSLSLVGNLKPGGITPMIVACRPSISISLAQYVPAAPIAPLPQRPPNNPDIGLSGQFLVLGV